MKNLFSLAVILCTCIFTSTRAQQGIITAGFQYKPIFPSTFFSTGPKTVSQNSIDFTVSQKMGYCAGMIIRFGLTKQFSFETGINYTKRNFGLVITDTSFKDRSDFTIVGYEIPFQGMIFLRMSDNIYMNTSLGISMDMYPTDIATKDTYFRHYSNRHSVFQFSTLANLGYEYRTQKSGYFYLGASYHLPFSYFYASSFQYIPTQDIARMKLGGNYLTVDFRYYFHEDPLKPKKKKAKKQSE